MESHIGAIVTAVTLLFGARKVYQNRGIPMSKLPGLVRDLHEQLKVKSFEPDVIIGVSRGGLMLAGLISEQVGQVAKPVATYRRIVEKNQDGKRVDIKVINDGQPIVSGLKVLIVCAECNHGITIQRAREYAMQEGASEVKTLTLYVLKSSVFQPDFYCKEYNTKPRLEWKDGLKDDESGE